MKKLLSGILIVLLIVVAAGVVAFRLSEQDQVIHITAKADVGGAGYVMTKGGESFKVGNSVPNFHFDSFTVFKSLKVGGWYKVRVSGWYLDKPFKMYRNIISAEQLNESSAVSYKENK